MKNTVLKIAAIILALGGLPACRKALAPADYIRWVNNTENGLTRQNKSEKYEVTAQYRPAAYMALIETGKSSSPESFESAKKNYEGTVYLALKIKSLNGKDDPLQTPSEGADYYTKLKYFTEDIRHDLYLVQGKDTLPCVLNHLERTYKLAPYTNLLLAFTEKEGNVGNGEMILVYDDKVLGLGKQTFEFNAGDIKDTPQIKF